MITINGQSAAALGAQDIRTEETSLGIDRLTFRVPRGPEEDFLFTHLQRVTLVQDGVTWFSGVCHQPQSATGGGAEQWHQYTVVGPGWYLAHTTYQQPWQVQAGAATRYSSRCILGIRTDDGHYGERQTMAQAITALLTFCRDACGLPVTAGDIVLPDFFQTTEVNGVSCLEAIRGILKLAPDVIGWWTFGAVNRLNLRKRAALPLTLRNRGDFDGEPVFTRVRGEAPSSVVLNYEVVETIDGQAVTNIVRDAAPSGADGLGLLGLVVTIPLNGTEKHYLRETISTRTIVKTLADLGKARRYWGAKLGLTGHVQTVAGEPETPEITFFKVDGTNYFIPELANPTGYAGGHYEDPLEDATEPQKKQAWARLHPNIVYNSMTARAERRQVLDPTLPRELVHGRVQPWMKGVKAQQWSVRLEVGYSLLGTTSSVRQKMTARLTATDATSREYSALESVIDGEEPPLGLASQIYAVLNAAHHSGSARRMMLDPGLALGRRLRVLGGSPSWATMEAGLQQVTRDFDRQTTDVTVGPPEHLGVQDFIERLRCQRGIAGQTWGGSARVRTRQFGVPD